MAYKQKKGKKYVAAYVNQNSWQTFTQTAALCELKLADALDEALEFFIEAKLPDLAQSIKSGTGVLSRFKNDPKIFKDALY